MSVADVEDSAVASEDAPAAGGVTSEAATATATDYLGAVVAELDSVGLAVDRVVVQAGRGGRVVFDGPSPASYGEPGWEPAIARWEAGRGWSLCVHGPGRDVRRRRWEAAQPPARDVAAFVAASLGRAR